MNVKTTPQLGETDVRTHPIPHLNPTAIEQVRKSFLNIQQVWLL
jgi:hypothetical protein